MPGERKHETEIVTSFGMTKILLMYQNFFFQIIFISWRLITLQYCSGFCHTLT